MKTLIYGLISNFKLTLLLGAVMALSSCNRRTIIKYVEKVRIEYDSTGFIPLHSIVNPKLKEQLIKFNEKFKDHPSAQGRGLYISFDMHKDSVHYDIGYSAIINHDEPKLLCEPIDGKPVYVSLMYLDDDFRLDERRSVELLKDFVSPSDYEFMKNESVIGIFDFVSWELVFDKNNNLIRVDTLGMVF